MRNYFKGNKNYKYYKSSDKRNLLNSKSKKISSKTAKKNNSKEKSSLKQKKIIKIKWKNIFILILLLSIIFLFIYFCSIFISNKDSSNNNPFKEEEIYTETINNNKISYLKDKTIKFYNKYIKICLDGILIDKNKYALPELPKISVIIPLYNAKNFLTYSLRSVQNQKMKEIEIILVDDFSKDDTLLLIKKYMEEDPRIRLIKNNENRKILYSKSIGALNAKGKYILELDQDDLFIRNDLFDILFNEAENNNLDLIQVRDICNYYSYLSNYNIKINTEKSHIIHLKNGNDTMPSHKKTNEELKNTIFLNGCLFPLWGLLIKADIYKKAIYYLWPPIINFKFTYYEDYLVSTIIVIFSNNYKYFNNFGLIRLRHRNAASFVYENHFYQNILVFENVLYKYYFKYNHPEDIKIIINLLKQYSYAYKEFYKTHPNLFIQSILQVLSNEYLTDNDRNFIRENLKIHSDDFKKWNSYEYLMNSTEFSIISNFQNSIINNAQTKNIVINEIKITIIIYCIEFNYLKNTINSIQNQNFEKFEIILIYDNDESSNLNLIQEYIRQHKNIKLINNEKKKGILFSYSNAILSSNGNFILLLKSGETLSKDNTLYNIYDEIIKDKTDILEFNLLINNCDTIKDNSLSLYKCSHIESVINFDYIKYNRDYINIDQEKDLLTNKLIKSSFFKSIINKYKIIDNQEIIYNYYDEIILFLFSKEGGLFKRINEYGIIKYISNSKKLYNNIYNNTKQKVNDAIFYIDFLFEHTSNSFDDKKRAINEFFNLLSIIYNKNDKENDKSIKLIEKFIKCEYISNDDKINLKFYHNSLIN